MAQPMIEIKGLTMETLWHLASFCPARRFQRGYDVRDPRIQHMMVALLDPQRDDGGWWPFWAAQSSPVHTAVALKTLVLSGALARADLESRIQVYTT